MEDKYLFLNDGNLIKATPNGVGGYYPILILKSPMSKQYAAYLLMEKDLNLVIEALNELKKENHSNLIKQSLTFFTVINYSKCFISNKGGRGTTLQTKDVFQYSSNILKSTHSMIWKLRMDYVAHAGSEGEVSQIVSTLYFDPPNTNNYIGLSIDASFGYIHSLERSIDEFIKLCDFVKNFIEPKRRKVYENLQKATDEMSLGDKMHYSVVPDEKTVRSITSNDFIRIRPTNNK